MNRFCIVLVSHSIILSTLLPHVQCAGIRTNTRKHGHRDEDDHRSLFLDPPKFFFFGDDHEKNENEEGPSSCPEAVAMCQSRHPYGTVSYDGWLSFLDKLGGDDEESKNDPGSPLARLRAIVYLASQLDSPAETYKQLQEGLANDQVASVLQKLQAFQQQQQEEGGEIQEQNLEPFLESVVQAIMRLFDFFVGTTGALAEIPIIGIPLAILFNLVLFPITIPTYVGFIKIGLKALFALSCITGASSRPFWCELSAREEAAGDVLESSAASATPSDRSCPADLFSCELEAFMADAIPEMLAATFREAGSV